MTAKARHLHHTPENRAISVDRLFKAAFSKSHYIYQRESLMGWRPVTIESEASIDDEGPYPPVEKAPSFTNSPDVKVHETSESIFIEVMLPDINEESLYLEVSGDLLIIRAEKAVADSDTAYPENQAKRPMVHRFIKLPVAAQPGKVQARLEGNVVRVQIGKPLAGFKNE
ncbi:MAG: Hsp20 family protein [Desulfobacteraceae bacterium]|jgi:HSP20 family molecular chaperone IbpA